MKALSLSPDQGAVLDIAVTKGADGRSRLERRRVCYPWSLGRGYPSGKGATSVTIIPQAAGAGLLAGDCFRQRISVGPGASLRLVAAGATQVHGAQRPRTSATSWLHSVDANAKAFIASEPHVMMTGASLLLHQDLVIDETAVFVSSETVVPGPGATDVSWRMETSLRRPDGAVIFNDTQVAGGCGLSRTRRLPGAFTSFATVLIVASVPSASALKQEIDRLLMHSNAEIWGASAILRGNAGLGVRIAASDGGRARDVVGEVQVLAANLLGF